MTECTAIEAASAVVNKLQTKREAVVKRVAEIAAERSALGFASHVEGNAEATRRLSSLNTEALMIDGTLQSLDAAIGEAGTRLEQALRAEALKEDRDNALLVKKKFARLNKLAALADEHLAAFAACASEIKNEVDALHQAGQQMPTSQQMMTFCGLATASVMMFLPWARVMEARHLSPSERRTFSKLFGDWSAAANRNISARLGEPEKLKDHADAPA